MPRRRGKGVFAPNQTSQTDHAAPHRNPHQCGLALLTDFDESSVSHLEEWHKALTTTRELAEAEPA